MAVNCIFVALLVQRMQRERPRVRFQLYEFLVDEGEFDCFRFECPSCPTSVIGVVVVDVDEVFGERLEDVEHSPFLIMDVAQMHLEDEVVNEFEILQGHGLQSRVLTAFAVDLKGDALICEVVPAEDIFVGVEDMRVGILTFGANANTEEGIHIIIFGANWSDPIGAVVLVVGHGVIGSNVAP